jgi:tetratricopeptide (TPR) repeat protein
MNARTGMMAAGEPRTEGLHLPQRWNCPRFRLRLPALAGGLAAVALCWAGSALARAAPPSSPSVPPSSSAPSSSAPPPSAPASQGPAAPGAFAGSPLPSAARSARALSSALSVLRPHLPAWVERWLYNPRERTAAAISEVKRGDRRTAVAAADSALRLAPAEPLASYNAGSARLAQAGENNAAGGAGAAGPSAPSGGGGLRAILAAAAAAADRLQARAAEPLLERAVKTAGPDLAPAASYNLGNARFTAGDFAGAVEAYKQTLRVAPRNAAAKFNLELAWREQQRQRQSSQRGIGPRGGGGRPREGERRETAGQGGSGAVGANPQPGQPREQSASSPLQGQSQGRGGQAQTAAGWRGQPSPLSGRQPLPGYQDQPEMSASEASAVLEAVQNLERQQRRRAAERLARQRAANGEDW